MEARPRRRKEEVAGTVRGATGVGCKVEVGKTGGRARPCSGGLHGGHRDLARLYGHRCSCDGVDNVVTEREAVSSGSRWSVVAVG
ncbi:hypothetical protein SESBI_10737 [Sesbania bispinosa]|nr:hypothetical protein SESBI_10737 [Sesbania bispinosa]